jgi:hypothetical protein
MAGLMPAAVGGWLGVRLFPTGGGGGGGDCVAFKGVWDTTDIILIDTTIPFNPALTFTPPPVSFEPPCGDFPNLAKCVTAQPGINHAFDPVLTLAVWAVEPTGPGLFEVHFNCDFKGSICLQFCCNTVSVEP